MHGTGDKESISPLINIVFFLFFLAEHEKAIAYSAPEKKLMYLDVLVLRFVLQFSPEPLKREVGVGDRAVGLGRGVKRTGRQNRDRFFFSL